MNYTDSVIVSVSCNQRDLILCLLANENTQINRAWSFLKNLQSYGEDRGIKR